MLVGIGLVYGTAVWDDRRIGRDETRIELLLPYMVRKEGQQVELGRQLLPVGSALESAKIAAAGIPVVVTPAAATADGARIAEDAGIAICGRVARNRLIVYSCPGRIGGLS